MPRIDVEKDWGLPLRGGWDTPQSAKRNVWDILFELSDEHDISIREIFIGRSEKPREIRELWYFIAREALGPWMSQVMISRWAGCKSHSTFFTARKRFEKRYVEERLLQLGPEGS